MVAILMSGSAPWALAASPLLPVPEEVAPYMADRYFRVSADVRFPRAISTVLNQSCLRHGKRVRPLMCYLSAGMVGVPARHVVWLAKIAEFTHSASLIHDDVIDASTHRRGEPSLWARTSAKQAVMTGDWLIVEAVKLAHRPEDSRHLPPLLDTIQEMARGEVLQARVLKQGSYTLEEWQRIADSKTGVLFAWALSAPALEYGMPESVVAGMRKLGFTLGRLFQAQDDMQDALDERGEVNLVLREAAAFEGTSPLSPTFREDSLQAGRARVLDFLKTQGAEAGELARQMHAQTEDWWKQQGFASSHLLRQSCASALLDLVGLFSRTPAP